MSPQQIDMYQNSIPIPVGETFQSLPKCFNCGKWLTSREKKFEICLPCNKIMMDLDSHLAQCLGK